MSEAIYVDKVVGKKKCPECGKVFDWFGECWKYKTQHKGKTCYYCSWTCWIAEEKRKGIKYGGGGPRG